jgi:hypothetical protein
VVALVETAAGLAALVLEVELCADEVCAAVAGWDPTGFDDPDFDAVWFDDAGEDFWVPWDAPWDDPWAAVLAPDAVVPVVVCPCVAATAALDCAVCCCCAACRVFLVLSMTFEFCACAAPIAIPSTRIPVVSFITLPCP